MSDTDFQPPGERRLSIYRFVNLFLRQRRIMIGLPLTAVIVAAAYTMTKKPRWVATSKIVAEGVQTTSPMSSIAEQFGVRIPASGGSGSPEFYAQLLRSPEVLTPVASRTYAMTTTEGERRSGYVIKLFEPKFPAGADPIRGSVDRLAENVASSPDPLTGIITLDVTSPARDLSIVLNREVISSANNFLQARRQNRAAEETKFVESRLDEARSQLAVAEAALRNFVSQNRQYQASPQLTLEAAQLERTVSLRQQVFVTLSQAYEQARIEAMRNISLISVLQRPEYSVSRRTPSLTRNVLLAFILGTLVAMGIVVARTQLAKEPLENPADVEEFRALMKDAVPKRARQRSRKVQDR